MCLGLAAILPLAPALGERVGLESLTGRGRCFLRAQWGLISAGYSAALLGAGEPDGLWPRSVGSGIEPAGEAGMRPTMNHRSISAVRSDALFVSALQPSQGPDASLA